MFHVELRQFPHIARAFNLSRDELDGGILAPWVAGQAVDFQERRWSPERARLSIYEGRALAADEIGLGRGWANAGRTGEDATERLLSEARHAAAVQPEEAELEHALLARCAAGAVALGEVVELAEPRRLASERLALAERAVWRLLHEGSVELVRGDQPLTREQWQPALLSWRAWTDDGVCVRAAGADRPRS